MITAANEVVNDPSSVGTALKTLTLRLRGSKTELEEMGEDVTDMATTTSQLQAKLLALTGGKVDIMLDENTFKNSTQILREMSAAWEDMNDIQRASALELMGGKRQANVLSALIQNFDTVEDVIETSANSAGSALKENERYLDSIAGKIDQFNNAVQSLWQNVLGSDVIKTVIDWATKIIKSLDTTQGKILAIVKAVALLAAYKKVNPLDWIKDIGVWMNTVKDGGGIVQWIKSLVGLAPAMKAVTAETIANTVATQTNDAAKTKQLMTNMGLAGATGTLSAAQKEQSATAILNAMTAGELTIAQGNAMLAMLGYTTSVNGANISLKALDSTTKMFMATNPVGWILAIVSAVVALTVTFVSLTNATKKAGEAAEEALSAYENAQNTLKSHKQTIEDIRKDYEKLADGVDELGNNVSLTSEEYERYNEIVNQIAEMFPDMVTGYTAEGDAIIALKGNVEELTKAYEEEARAANAAIVASSDDIFKAFSDKYNKNPLFATGKYGLKEQSDFLNKLISVSGDEEQLENFWGDLNNLSKEVIINGKQYNDMSAHSILKSAGIDSYDFRSSTSGELNDVEAFKKLLPKIQAYAQTLTSTINAETAKVKPILSAYLYNDLDYAKLNTDAQSIVQKIINTFDASFYAGFENATDLMSYVNANIVRPLQDIDTYAEFEAAFDLQTKFNKGEVSVQEYEDMVSGIISLINSLGLENADSIIKSIKLILDVDDSGAINGNIQEAAKSLLKESDYDKIKTLTKSELDIINQNASKWSENTIWNGSEWEIGEPILMSWDQLIEKIEDAKSTLESQKSSDYIQSFTNIKENLGGLGEAFDQFTEDGKISIDTLSDLNEKFSNVDGFEDFINVLGNSASTTEQVESAISNMASAYLATTDILSNVTDANYDFVISQLKALGVTNPEEYLRNLQSVHQAMSDQYNVDLSNYGTVEQMKQAISGDLYNILIGMENMTINELASKYGDDLHNYASLEEAKTEAARREALKRQEILRGENMTAGEEDAAGWRNSQTVEKDEINTGWWIFGKNKYKGKSYSEMEALANAGDSKAKAWVEQIQSTYDTMIKESSSSAESAYTDAVNEINGTIEKFNSIDDYVAQYNLKLKVDVPSLGDDLSDDKKLEEELAKLMEDFQKEMDYWENRIGANQSKYEQLQNEIDLLEKKGQKADASFYHHQMALENGRLRLLVDQKKAAEEYLDTLENSGKKGSEEWWEVANVLNDIESELDDVTASMVDLQDAIAEIDAYKFEEFNTRLDNLTSKLETIRDLIAPNGEEDWFDDEGNWTESGIAVLGSYLQELETYKQGYQNTMDELAKYELDYEGNQSYYDGLGIHSEQEWYDKTEELISQQYDFAQSISDTEQSVVDMYENSIDAVEEYMETLIDGYNDYIDSVKEALDAERDLYDFKKNVEKQAKDISELERRIASLSGSTNAADIAERRKLEAQLYESRESLNDTYYDHAKDAQQEALDAEASAYEETMTKMVEGMRTSLEEATSNMETFLGRVTDIVSLNAGVILNEYKNTGLLLDPALTTPWENARDAVADYSGDALELMNTWTQEGFLTTFSDTVENSLSSPWSAGSSAAASFTETVGRNMSAVVSNIESNVIKASGSLSKLYQQIQATALKAESVNVDLGSGSDSGSGGGSGYAAPTPTGEGVRVLQEILKNVYYKSVPVNGIWDSATSAALSTVQRTIGVNQTGEYDRDTAHALYNNIGTRIKQSRDNEYTSDAKLYEEYRKKLPEAFHAKGTLGTKRNEWAITDEPKFGDELVLVPGKDGNLSFMRKGTGVVPADMTEKLWELAQIPTSDLMRKNITAIVPDITKNDIKNEFNFDSLVHVDYCDQNTLKDLEKMVDTKINDFSKQMNYSLKRFAR